ncbi:plasmid maintenance system antidote protein VapI [Duganella sp. 1224]|uniref:helix-turn-helix domain-containing protein n=1 Tax=Duganella sp. 1224 TaxID=2587052 RepID=UPI0015CEAA47|nr:helix-turn-helix domain-containing protein [Duganella sp. 1224]NYE58983.1 plasmid maintenance system antidote protein VapI [Duganella sp. 1224]
MRTHYDPNYLLDMISARLGLKNDAALARELEVAAPVVSKIRHLRLPVSGAMLIRIHEVTGMQLRELQDLMGDRRQKFRLSSAQGRPAMG